MTSKNFRKNTKENIFNSWIMVERLQEGTVDKKYETRFKTLSHDDDFYSAFKKALSNKHSAKSGIILLCDRFPVGDVINALRQNLGGEEEWTDTKYLGERFSFLLRFDSHLRLLKKKTFVTACGYMKNIGSVPTCVEFSKYKNDVKKKIEKSFIMNPDDYDDDEELTMRDDYNEALRFILVGECCFCRVSDIDRDFQSFNSFFANDLEKARDDPTVNLDKYITGIDNEDIIMNRVNLDTKKDSVAFDGKAVANILQPKNFPLSRYPSNPDYALSLMQQVAVNIAIGYDNQQMRSVNGPPGTGKSTLLYDVFSELVVEQAYEIAKMSAYERRIINGKLPENISDKGIVVASSNNAALKNIVDELPQIGKIHKDFEKLLMETDYFCAIANGEESDIVTCNAQSEDNVYERWGLFSMEGGRAENEKKILDTVERVADELRSEDYLPHEEVYDKFIDLYNEISDIRSDLQVRANNIERLEKNEFEAKEISEKLEKTTARLAKIERDSERTSKKCDELKTDRPTLFFIPLLKASREYKAEFEKLRSENKVLKNEKQRLENDCSLFSERRETILSETCNLTAKIETSERKNGGTKLDFDLQYRDLQLSSPWFSKDYRVKQSELFALALAVRKQFLYENQNNVRNAFLSLTPEKDKKKRNSVSDDEVCNAWKWINLVIPVISTTFSSAARMFGRLGRESIGNLFIDEAGQAVPWAAVGLIYRSKRVMAVGDPSQIEPVLTLDDSVLEFVRDAMHVSGDYLSDKASVQSLMDSSGKYGFYKNENEWIGIPLWVHRRCLSPMFDISNEISYGGNMVQGNFLEKRGYAEWWDIHGEAHDKYVEEQGEKVKDFIKAISDGKIPEYDTDRIYVITPFRNVAERLAKKLDEIGFTKRENGKPINIGTVHTFQGKETDTVIVVLGTDENSRLAADWAMGSDNANMMNVAATRAKKTLIIVGDKELYEGLDSKVINKTVQVINFFDSGDSLLARLCSLVE